MLGGYSEDDAYNVDSITHINTAFSTLNQLGVGPQAGFWIKGDTEVWGDFINDDAVMQAVKTYVYQKVKLIFDPPTSSSHLEAMKQSIAELEWRLNVQAESTELHGGF